MSLTIILHPDPMKEHTAAPVRLRDRKVIKMVMEARGYTAPSCCHLHT